MASFNRIIIVGNLTRDPDYKQLTSGQAVCRLGIASNRQFKNKQSGSMIQEVCYVDIDVWGPQAESCRQYLQKGRPILVEGRLKLDSWEDANGQTRSKHSIVADRVVFLGSNQSSEIDDKDISAAASEPAAAPASEMEKDLLNQIQSIKSRGKTGYATKPEEPAKKRKGKEELNLDGASVGGEIDFKDEPPFQDDLPF